MYNILNYQRELKPCYFNNLKVKKDKFNPNLEDTLIIPLSINCPYSFIKLYNLLNCNIGGDNDDYFYCIDNPKILSCAKFGLLMERQHNIY